MLYTEDFSMRHYVGFLQNGSQIQALLFLQIIIRLSRTFLHAFCKQEGAWSLYNFFYNHNYQEGTGNFTFKALILAGQQKALYHQNYLARKQLYILCSNHPAFHLQLQLVTQLVSQLAILYYQNYLPRNQEPAYYAFIFIYYATLQCSQNSPIMYAQEQYCCQTIMLLYAILHCNSLHVANNFYTDCFIRVY